MSHPKRIRPRNVLKGVIADTAEHAPPGYPLEDLERDPAFRDFIGLYCKFLATKSRGKQRAIAEKIRQFAAGLLDAAREVRDTAADFQERPTPENKARLDAACDRLMAARNAVPGRA